MIPTAALEQVTEFVLDGTHGSPERVPFGVPLFSAQHIRDGHLDRTTDRFTTEAEYLSFSRRLTPRAGDVLLTIVGTIGRAAVLDWEFNGVLQRSVAVLRPVSDKLDSRYLFRTIETAAFQNQLRSATNQSSQAGVYLGKLKKLTVPLPPLAEQRRIATILDKADALRSKRRTMSQTVEQFSEAVFLRMFADSQQWEECTVEELACDRPNAIRTGPFGSQLLHSEFVDEGIPVLGIDNVVQNKFVWARPRFVTERKYQSLKRYTVLPRDVLITIMGTCGRCAIVPDDIGTAINTKHLCCITLDPTRCRPRYLHDCFLTHPTVLRQLGVHERGAVMPGLNMQLIKQLTIPVPPLTLQQQYETVQTQIDGLRIKGSESCDRLEEAFASLQQRAFAGAL